MLLSRFHPKFPDSDISSSKNGLFFPQLNFLCRQEIFFSATFYCSSSDFGGNAECGEAMGTSLEIPTSFCNVRRRFSCCLLTVSPVAGLWLSHDWPVHRQAAVFWLF